MKILRSSENLARLEKIRDEKFSKAVRSLPTLHQAKKASVGLLLFSVGLTVWSIYQHTSIPTVLLSLSGLCILICSRTIAAIEALRKTEPNQALQPTALLGRG